MVRIVYVTTTIKTKLPNFSLKELAAGATEFSGTNIVIDCFL